MDSVATTTTTTTSSIHNDNRSLTASEQFDIEDPTINGKDEVFHNSEGLKIVISGFFGTFLVFGISFSYGVFQEFYTSSTGPLNKYSAAEAAMVGTVGTSLTYITTLFNKPIMYYIQPRYLMMIGTLISTIGLVTVSLCSSLIGFVFTQGVLFGIGCAFIYAVPPAIAPYYYKKHRGAALGIVFSGTGFGGFAMAYITRALLSKLDWKWAIRCLSLINLVIGLGCSLLVTTPDVKGFRTNTSILNLQQIGSGKVWLVLSSSFLQSAAYIIPLFFMSKYGLTLGFSTEDGALFIGVNNLVNAIFKIIFGLVADRYGKLNVSVWTNTLTTVTVFALWLVGTRSTFISFVIIYGVFSGATTSLIPLSVAEIFGVHNYQALLGIMYFARGLGTMVGSPVAGQLIKGEGLIPGNYINSIIYCGALLAASSIAMGVLRLSLIYKK